MRTALKGFFAVFFRECRRIATHKDLRLVCFVAPLIYGIILSAVYASRRVYEVPVGVLDLDNTRISRTLVRWIDATQNVSVTHRYERVEEANRAMTDGTVAGLFYIPRDFSNELKRGHSVHVLAGVNSSNIIVANPVMQSFMETTGTVSAGSFIRYLRKMGLVRDKALSLNQAIIPEIKAVYNPKLNYSDFFLPGMLFVVIQQIVIVGLAFSVAEEREKKRGAELLGLAEGKRLALLFGKILPYSLLNFLISFLFIVVLLPAFGIGLSGFANWVGTLTFVYLFLFSVTTFGVLVSSLFESTLMALIVLMFYSMPAFLLSGYAWPASALPKPLYALGLLFPSTYFIRGFRLLVLGHVPLSYVLPNVLMLVAFSVVCLVGAYYAFCRLPAFKK